MTKYPSRKPSADQFAELHLGRSSPLRNSVWRIRRKVRDVFGGRDILDVEVQRSEHGKKVRETYRTIDTFMGKFFPKFVRTTPKKVATARLRDMIEELGYDIVDADEAKPWGAFYRLDGSQAERFIKEFFPGLTPREARLGQEDAELSPKFLLVLPGQQLSWQYHNRRAERWRFLTTGAYYKSSTDMQGNRHAAQAGDVVQFAKGERHRLSASSDEEYTLVAEIWQHVDPANISDEDDIVRLADDYRR